MSVATTGQHNLLGQILKSSAGPATYGAGGAWRFEPGGARGPAQASRGWQRLVLPLLLLLAIGLALAW